VDAAGSKSGSIQRNQLDQKQMMQEKWALTALAIVMMATNATPGLPCGYHGRLGEGFSALHPRSIGVAVAIREAADEDLLDREVVAPEVVDMLALNRASMRLVRLREALQRTSNSPQRAFSVLLIESGMWEPRRAQWIRDKAYNSHKRTLARH
jgi:hypothetical protein